MPISIPQRLISAIKEQRLVPFVGAGLSKQADASRYPTWTELLFEMIKHSRKNHHLSDVETSELREMLKKERHLAVAQHLKERLPRDYYIRFLEQMFDPPNALPANAHRLLLSLKPRFIITTNYDRLIETAYARDKQRALTIISYNDAAKLQRRLQEDRHPERPFLYKIHGDIEDVGDIILAEEDYRKLLYDAHGHQSVLGSIFIHFTVLFLGFSFNDPELIMHLGRIRHALKGMTNPDYILMEEKSVSSVESERFRKDYGLEVSFYPQRTNHQGLEEYLAELCRAGGKT